MKDCKLRIEDRDGSIARLLNYLSEVTAQGSGTEVTVETGDGKRTFYIDGDGGDHFVIDSRDFKFNQKELKELMTPKEESGMAKKVNWTPKKVVASVTSKEVATTGDYFSDVSEQDMSEAVLNEWAHRLFEAYRDNGKHGYARVWNSINMRRFPHQLMILLRAKVNELIRRNNKGEPTDRGDGLDDLVVQASYDLQALDTTAKPKRVWRAKK